MTTATAPVRETLRVKYDRCALSLARDVLSDFIVDQAERTAVDIGFGWTPQVDGPSDYDTLRRTFAHCQATGQPLPISSEQSDDVIYTSPLVNTAMRFWHDVNHVRRNLSFELADELELGLWHLEQCTKAGFGPDTHVWRLLQADLIGQAQVMAFGRRFPFGQRRFVEGCLTMGPDQGLLAELRRSS